MNIQELLTGNIGVQRSNLSEMRAIKKILDGNGGGSIAGKTLDLGSKLLGGFSRK
ncbi:Uncharacterised protein [Candidatus Ornithobacterium hominis]|uniref:Uncharacterized protein n=1 Tax=Candidatus Ornithobacterium hominis TaxID=2497989 RepID=A0A383TXK5_9FLAO|nr:hypothetical protein [Candidatus Ornithobacterium hominis]MCT7904090.1 hypothetical protein [Candidatus Ornithobacterium hominis]SZD72372.1 Uncharacterised protein [Candidatus Ornithobacterium hominis]